MAIIYRDKDGNLVKESSMGCDDCGFKNNKTKVLKKASKKAEEPKEDINEEEVESNVD